MKAKTLIILAVCAALPMMSWAAKPKKNAAAEPVAEEEPEIVTEDCVMYTSLFHESAKNKQYADMVTELGLDGYGYKDVTLDDSLKSTLRAAHDSMRDAGMPLNDIGIGMLQIIAGNRDKLPNISNGGTAKAAGADNVDLSGIVDVLKDRL